MVVEHLSLGGCEEMDSMALYTLLAVFPSNKVWLDDFSEINNIFLIIVIQKQLHVKQGIHLYQSKTYMVPVLTY